MMSIYFTTKTFLRLRVFPALLFLLLALISLHSFAQTEWLWQNASSKMINAFGTRYSTSQNFRTLQLNVVGMPSLLADAPMEFTAAARSASIVISLPRPDGTLSE